MVSPEGPSSCRILTVKIEGDQEGIAILKSMTAQNKEYLKMLIAEARTNSDHKAYFKNEDGSRRYALRLVPATGDLVVEPA